MQRRRLLALVIRQLEVDEMLLVPRKRDGRGRGLESRVCWSKTSGILETSPAKNNHHLPPWLGEGDIFFN